jgi:hypothetical protein
MRECRISVRFRVFFGPVSVQQSEEDRSSMRFEDSKDTDTGISGGETVPVANFVTGRVRPYFCSNFNLLFGINPSNQAKIEGKNTTNNKVLE